MIKHIKLDMFDWIVQKFFGTKNERELKKYYPLVRKISELEPEIVKLSDDELKEILRRLTSQRREIKIERR